MRTICGKYRGLNIHKGQAQLGVLVTRGHVLGHVTHGAYSLAFPEVQLRQTSPAVLPGSVVVSSGGIPQQ